MDWAPDQTERTNGDEAPPKGIERRLVLRLLSYWRGLCTADRALPSFEDVDPAAIPEMWRSCFVLDVLGHERDPVFRHVGADYAACSPVDLADSRVSEAPPNSLVFASVRFVPEVIAKGVPISRGGEFMKTPVVKVLYRSIVLPMSDDGETISGLLGAANCREVDVSQQARE